MFIRLRLDKEGRYKEFFGTPTEIVDQMRAADLFGSYGSRREYIEKASERLAEVSEKPIDLAEIMEADDETELSIRFLAAVIRDPDLGSLVVNERTFDGSTVKTVRAAAHLSQAKFAQLLGVDPQTVSRWERERTRPSSGAVINAVREKSRTRALVLEEV